MALKFLTPFRVAIGVFCLCISLLLIYSLLVNNLERLFDSDCGAKCGFILTKSPTYFNPLDAILLRLSSHHEKWFDFHCSLDTTLFAILLIYVFICVIYGLVRIGIGFLSPTESRIRRRDSSPQSLSILSGLVILMMFAFSMQLMSMAPVYLTFGDQRLPGTDKKCTLDTAQT